MAALFLLILSISCGTESTTETLIDHNAWQATPTAEDPFANRRNNNDTCSTDAYAPESLNGEATISVETVSCSFVTLQQPLAATVTSGDRLQVRLWHFDLDAGMRTSAYLALAVDTPNGVAMLWTREIAIPADATLLEEAVTAPTTLPAGTTLYFHIDNHGANSYNLIDFIKQ